MNALELSDKLWNGEIDAPASLATGDLAGAREERNPFVPLGALTEVAAHTAFVSSFANSCVFDTEGGLVMVDTGAPFAARGIHTMIRTWSPARLDTAVYSHGHIDHVFGVPVFEEEAVAEGWAPPRAVAHEAMPARFDRYILTAGYNGVINSRQFGADVPWPTEYRYPDETYRDRLDLDIGGERFELHHARGETDDHTWTYVPGRKVLCTGDLVIWCVPNAGNPQKVQRYAREWSVALREMAGLGAEFLLPGHGLPVAGADRVQTILTDTADLLDHLHDETVRMMNEGASLNTILHEVQAPSHLLEKPYLRPIYDDPEFVVRNVWRLYGGWYDFDPANLKPARSGELGAEVAALAGGVSRLAERARELAAEGQLRLAAHLVEFAAAAAPDDAEVHRARAEVYEARVEAEPALMAKGVFGAAARDSRAKADDGA
ncbi:MAG: MBL fold metallo-hydrolase [Actinobacteria bacterium]|nr:MBL fold metallo-hydrolase [Actinomycetota bacterium]